MIKNFSIDLQHSMTLGIRTYINTSLNHFGSPGSTVFKKSKYHLIFIAFSEKLVLMKDLQCYFGNATVQTDLI